MNLIQSGATCVGGKWSPAELPKCSPGQHPRLRWRRRKRSLDLRKARGKFLLNHYRNIKRQHYDHQNIENFVKVASKREKRDLESYRGRPVKILQKPRSIFKRDDRHYSSEIDHAYSKYYESIKARYRNYVKNLFLGSKSRSHIVNNNSVPLQSADDMKSPKKHHGQDGRWFNYNNPEFRYRSNKLRSLSNNEQQIDDEIEPAGPPVALPSINDPIRTNRYEVESELNLSVSNYYPRLVQNHEKAEEPEKKINSTTDLLLAQLQSDMRRKRETDDDGKGEFEIIR